MSYTVYNFAYTGAVQQFTIPKTGIYRIECWGGSGGAVLGGVGGLGGYAKGEKRFSAGDIIYIYIGGASAAFNGGGIGSAYGGGGTDVRMTNGAWNNVVSLNSRIIVAGGGGGAERTTGGAGGGLVGGNPIGLYSTSTYAGPGTQTAGGAGAGVNGSWGTAGGFGYGGSSTSGDIGPGGGGGWYGGGGMGYAGGAGGGSSYVGTLKNTSTITGINSGNGKVVISHVYDELTFFFEKDGKYYIPTRDYFDPVSKTFIPLTISQVAQAIDNDPTLLVLYNVNTPFTIGTTTYKPSDYLDLYSCKLCIVPIYSIINTALSKITMTYIPSDLALSKSTIKIKEFWIPLNEDLSNPYINVTGSNLSGANYKLDYYTLKTSASNSCDVMDCEVLKDNFWTSFIFTNPTTVLKSYGVYTIDKVNYTKIKDIYLDISDNYDNTSVTFKDAYTKILINKIKPISFTYYKETIDTF